MIRVLLIAAALFLAPKIHGAEAPTAPGPAQQGPPKDVIIRAGGQPVAGTILSMEGDRLNLSVLLKADQPPATLSVPVSAVEKVIFAENTELDALLKNATPKDLGKVLALWRSRQSLLPLPESDSGSIGLTLANLYLQSGFKDNFEDAFQLFSRLEKEDWSPARRSLARQGRLRTLIAMGRSTEAVAEAAQLEKDTEDPSVLIEAKFVLAEASRHAFEKLVEENPRWDEDPQVRPERNRLYHELIDLYYFPFLFHGDQPDAAARGLLALTLFFQAHGPAEQASELASDLIVLYPGTPEAEKAAALLETLPPALNPLEPNQENATDASQS